MRTHNQRAWDRIEQLRRECEYAPDPSEADYPVNDSVDALIAYKDRLEDEYAGLLEQLRAACMRGSAADQAQAVYELLAMHEMEL